MSRKSLQYPETRIRIQRTLSNHLNSKTKSTKKLSNEEITKSIFHWKKAVLEEAAVGQSLDKFLDRVKEVDLVIKRTLRNNLIFFRVNQQ